MRGDGPASQPDTDQSASDERRSQLRTETPYERAQRTEEDRLEAERRRARARAARVQVSITARAGNAAGCVQVQPRWENSINEVDGNPSYWVAMTNYYVTNTCGYPIYTRITARLANEDVSAWNTVEGPSGSGPTFYPFPMDRPFPQNLGFQPTSVIFVSGMFAGQTFSGSRWQQPAAEAQNIVLLVMACAPIVRYERGQAITQTMLRNSSFDAVPTNVVCVDHPSFTARPPPDQRLLSLFRIGTTAPPGEDARLTRCLNRDGALSAAAAEASCGELAAAQMLPAPLRALGLYNQGLARLRAGDAEEGLHLTAAAIQTHPTADAYVNLAAANYRLTFRNPRATNGAQIDDIAAISDAYQRALDAYDQALRIDPDHPTAARMRAFVREAMADPYYVQRAQRRARAEQLFPGEMEQVRQACREFRPEEQENPALERARLRRLGDLNRSSEELRSEANGYDLRIPFSQEARAEFSYLACLLRTRGEQISARTFSEARQLFLAGTPPVAEPNLVGLSNGLIVALLTGIGVIAFFILMLIWRPFARRTASADEEIELAEDKDTPAAPYEATMFGLTLGLFALPFTIAIVLLSPRLVGGYVFAGYSAGALAWIGVPLSAFVGGWIAYKWIASHPRDMGFFKSTWLAFVAGLLGLISMALFTLALWPLLVLELGEGRAGQEMFGAAILLLAGSVGGFIMARLWLPFFLGLTRGGVRSAKTRCFVWACALVLPLALTAAFGLLRSDELEWQRAQWAIEDYAPSDFSVQGSADIAVPAPAPADYEPPPAPIPAP